MNNPVLRFILLLSGSISLVLGIIGIFLPLLPTTPFLLLTVICYAKGSDKLYGILLKNKWLFSYITDYKEGKGIKPGVKFVAIMFLWVSMLSSLFIFTNPGLFIKIILITIAIIVTVHILFIKSKKGE